MSHILHLGRAWPALPRILFRYTFIYIVDLYLYDRFDPAYTRGKKR